MPGPTLDITDRGRMADLVAALALHAPHHVPLFRAAHDGLIGIVQPARDGVVSVARLRRMSGKPWLVLIGDDDGLETGPDGWASARRVLSWASQIVIHGAGGHAEHYAGAAAATLVERRFVLVECASAQVDAWHQAALRWAPRAKLMRVLPAIGPHPLPLDKSKMQ